MAMSEEVRARTIAAGKAVVQMLDLKIKEFQDGIEKLMELRNISGHEIEKLKKGEDSIVACDCNNCDQTACPKHPSKKGSA